MEDFYFSNFFFAVRTAEFLVFLWGFKYQAYITSTDVGQEKKINGHEIELRIENGGNRKLNIYWSWWNREKSGKNTEKNCRAVKYSLK